jgi:hypothetical protein
MAKIPKKKKSDRGRNGDGDGKENEQGGETPMPGNTAAPASVQERLNERQRAQFKKIQKAQGEKAASEYRIKKLAVNRRRSAAPSQAPQAPSEPQYPAETSPTKGYPQGMPTDSGGVDPNGGLNNPDFWYPGLGDTPENLAGGMPDFLGLGNIKDLVNQLNPDLFAMGPDNYTPSAYYDQMQKTGSEQLDKAYAKRGLFGSGAAIQGQSDLTQKLLADDVERAKALHAERQGNLMSGLTNLMGTYSNNLNNFYGLKQGYDTSAANMGLNLAEFDNKTRQQGIDNKMNLFRELLGMNPLGTAATMSGQGAGIDQGYAGGIADATGNIFNRPTQTSNFGGGSGPYVAPPPGGPDYTARDRAALQAQIANIMGPATANWYGSGQGGTQGSGNSLSQIGNTISGLGNVWKGIRSLF